MKGIDITDGSKLWNKIIDEAAIATTAAADLKNFVETDTKISRLTLLGEFHLHFCLLQELTDCFIKDDENKKIAEKAEVWSGTCVVEMNGTELKTHIDTGLNIFSEYLRMLEEESILPSKRVVGGYGFS